MFLRPRPIAVLFTLALCISTAEAQTDVFPNLWATDARVEGMAILGDTVFVGGRFRRVGPPTGQVVVLDKTTGEADISQPRFSAPTLRGIRDIVLDGAGGYYVAGQFSFVSGQERLNIAHVLADGTLDPVFRPAVLLGGSNEFDGYVECLTLGDGVLYIAGRFDSVSGQPRQSLAALDASTGAPRPLSITFTGTPFPNTADPTLSTLAVRDGVLYVGGFFTAVNGMPRPGLAALSLSGSVLPWGPSLTVGPPSVVPSVGQIVVGDETLYINGAFDRVNGLPREGIAELTPATPTTGEGGAPTSWAPTSGTSNPLIVRNLIVVGDDLYGVGTGLVRIGRASAQVQMLLPELRLVRSLAYDPSGSPSGQGTLYIGARRPTTSVGGGRYPVLLAVDPATGQPTGFEVPGATEDSEITALAVGPGPSGRLIAGGDLATLGAGVGRRQGLAAFDLATGLPTDFAADRTSVGANEDLALSPDGRFLYGYTNAVGSAILDLTEFDLATGATRQFVQNRPAPTPMSAEARTATLRASAPRTVVNPRVENATSAIVVTDDGAGGGRVCVSLSGVACFDRVTTELLFFTSFSGTAGQGENNGDLLYLPPDGPIVGPGGAQGTLFLAGPIERSGTSDLRRPALAAIDYATGDVIASWEPGFRFAGAEGYALALLDPDGTSGPQPPSLYGGGNRDWFVGSTPRAGLAAFDPQTAALRPWGARAEGAGFPLALAAHRTVDGRGVVYAGGFFSLVNGVSRACCVAAFDAVTGAYREDWQPFGEITFVLIASEQHQAVFMGGFGGALRGTGHSGIVAVSPASPILPTAGEATAEAPVVRASVSLAGPNPLRRRTTLALTLPEAQAIRAELVDVLGRRVSVLHDGVLPAGTSRIEVDATALPAGVYVVRVSAGTFTEALTLTVVR